MEIKKLTLTYTWKHKQPRIAKIVQNHFKKKNPIDTIIILYFKLHYTVKITCSWHFKKKIELILPLMVPAA